MSLRRPAALGVGADTALATVGLALSAGINYAFRLVVLGALPTKADAGIYSLTIAWLTLGAAIADFGLTATIMPRLSVARGPDTPAFKAALVLRLGMFLVSWLGLNVWLWLSGHSELLLLINLGYGAVLISTRLTGLRQLLEFLWRLKGRAYAATAFALVDSLLGLAAVVVLSSTGGLTVAAVALLWTLTAIPGFALLAIPLLPTVRRSESMHLPMHGRYLRALLIAAVPVGVMGFLGQVSGQLETFVLNWAGSLADVGAFNVAISPVVGLMFIPGAIGLGLMPLVSQLHRGGRDDVTMRQVVSLGARVLGTLGLGLCALAALFADHVMGLFPKEYAGDGYMLRLYSVVTALVFLVVMFDQMLIAVARRRQVLIGAILNLVVAIVLEMILIRWFGIVGMLGARIVTVVILIFYQLRMLRRDMRRGALEGLLRLLLPAALFGVGYATTAALALPIRATAIFGVTIIGLVVARTLPLSDLRLVRRLRLS